MHALCRCHAGHWFRNRVEADEADVNTLVLADDVCPTCGAEFDITEMIDDED